jgi:hypothetical protein
MGIGAITMNPFEYWQTPNAGMLLYCRCNEILMDLKTQKLICLGALSRLQRISGNEKLKIDLKKSYRGEYSIAHSHLYKAQKAHGHTNYVLYISVYWANFTNIYHCLNCCIDYEKMFYNIHNMDTLEFKTKMYLEHNHLLFPLFVPLSFNIHWRTSDAVGIARSMYAEDNYACGGILKDALQDAGCEDENVLSMLDSPYLCRGCWLLEQLMLK